MARGAKKGFKTLICPNSTRRYRYRLPTALFCTSGTGTGESGTGTAVPFFLYFFLYFFIFFVNWEQ